MLKRVFFCLISFSLLFGFNLDKEIERILKLPPNKRYIELNKLKLKILELKEKEREKLIKQLLKHYHINNAPSESIIKDSE